MKKIFILLSAAFMLLSFIACKGDNVEEQSSLADSSSEKSSEVISSTESESSVLESSEETSSEESSKSESSEPAVKEPENYNTTVGDYTIYDVNNSRGLSNVKSGFSFGVAKNGQPHQISVNNQQRFDSLQNVSALALDTVSSDKRMYLTFDCGYEYNNLTANMLDTLKQKNVKAAFFLTLSYIKKNPQLVQRMIDEGHIIGNHSATHPSFPNISRTKMAEELWRVDEQLQNNFGYKTRYFRFPSGENSENSLELVSSVGYKSIFWSLAYADYDTSKQVGYDTAFKTVTDRFHSGAVILLHSVSQDNADILGAVIDKAHEQGYTFKTLDDYYNR